jgi:hypothetical protein
MTLRRVARFFLVGATYQNGGKYTKWPQNIPNGHKIYHMTTKYTKCTKNLSPRTVLSSRHKTKGQICPYRGPSFMGFAIRKVMATKKKPNVRKIYHMATKYTYQHLLLQDSPTFTQIGIFGLKIYHLATLTLHSSHLKFDSKICILASDFGQHCLSNLLKV